MKRFIKGLFFFSLAVFILVIIAFVFATPAGCEYQFPLHLRLHNEECKTDTNSYGVYYNSRPEVAHADIVIVGIDFDVYESFDMLSHFTRFVKLSNNFSCVMIDIDGDYEKIINSLFRLKNEEKYDERLAHLKVSSGISDAYCDYISSLYYINKTAPETKKFSVALYNLTEDDSFNDNEQSAETEITGAEPSQISGILLAERINECANTAERGILCVVDARELRYDSDFMKAINSSGKKVFVIQTWYTESCDTDNDITVTFPLEPSESKVYFVSNSSFTGFYNYYSFCADLFGTSRNLSDRLDRRFTDYFFVITGGRHDQAGR